MTFFNTSDYPGYYTQIGVIQPFLSHICGNPKVPDILTRLEDVEVLDFIYENSLNEKKYNSEDYTTKDEEKDYEYPEYEEDNNDAPAKVPDKEILEVSDQENEVDKEKDASSPINLRKTTEQ